MEITSTAPLASKSPEPEPNTPTGIQHGKPFTNGVLKRHRPLPPPPQAAVVATYRECQKNHAASLGGHALDGCGEFMPSPSATTADPTSLKCAACGCHRNFHRRDPDDSPTPPLPLPPPPSTAHAIEYHPHHRHNPPPPRSPSSASPPPISSSYGPRMLMVLSSGVPSTFENPTPVASFPTAMISPTNPSSSRKRFRTKFSQSQKEKMLEFAEQVGWRIQKRDDDLIRDFCADIGIDRNVLKVWMHNNKNTFAKKDANNPDTGNGSGDGNGLGDEHRSADPNMGTNGSSSTS